MKAVVAVLAFVVAACAPAGPQVLPDPLAQPKPAPSLATPSVPVIANAGFEEGSSPGGGCPLRWSCSVHADGSSFRFGPDKSTFSTGASSLLVERVGKEPWAIVTQSFRAQPLRGQRIRFSIAVRTQDVDGDGAGPWLLLLGDEKVLDHQVRRVKGTTAWKRHEIELVVPARADTLSVGATLEGGGRAWFDDAKLELVGPAPSR